MVADGGVESETTETARAQATLIIKDRAPRNVSAGAKKRYTDVKVRVCVGPWSFCFIHKSLFSIQRLLSFPPSMYVHY